MPAALLKRCPWCAKAAAFDALGRQQMLCGSPECSRRQATERKRRSRRRMKEAAQPPTVTPDGNVITPFGTFDSADAAWLAALTLDTGQVDQWRGRWLDEHHVPSPDDLIALLLA